MSLREEISASPGNNVLGKRVFERRRRNDKAQFFCFVLYARSGDVFHHFQNRMSLVVERHVEEVDMPVVKSETALG